MLRRHGTDRQSRPYHNLFRLLSGQRLAMGSARERYNVPQVRRRGRMEGSSWRMAKCSATAGPRQMSRPRWPPNGAQGPPVVLHVIVGGVGFYQRTEIKDALAMLRLAVTPDTVQGDVAFRRIINPRPRLWSQGDGRDQGQSGLVAGITAIRPKNCKTSPKDVIDGPRVRRCPVGVGGVGATLANQPSVCAAGCDRLPGERRMITFAVPVRIPGADQCQAQRRHDGRQRQRCTRRADLDPTRMQSDTIPYHDAGKRRQDRCVQTSAPCRRGRRRDRARRDQGEDK